jgi:hypothetical protein
MGLFKYVLFLLNQNTAHKKSGNRARNRLRVDADQLVSSINIGAVENANDVKKANK